MHRLKALLIVLAISTLGFSCEVINPEEEVPAYITIENAQILVDANSGFTTDLGLRDAWVYQGGQLQGIYPLPATFPYQNIETTDFYVLPGIYESGLSAFHVPYPFLDRVDFTVTQGPGDTAIVSPTFEYLPNTQISMPVAETFEAADVNFAPFAYFSADTARLKKSGTDVYRGNRSGYVYFDDDSRHFEVASINPSPMVLEPGNDGWLEITYKSDIELTVGLVYQNPAEGVGVDPAVTLLPKANWNTVYVHLIDILKRHQASTTDYSVWLYARSDGQNAELFLDDIRLVHFK